MRRFVGAVAVFVAATTGCTLSTGMEPGVVGGLSFAATTIVSPPASASVETTATVTNQGADSVTVHYGSCPLDVIVRTDGYSGPIVYETATLRICDAASLQKTLGPGQALTFSERDTPKLPPGTYFVTVQISVNGTASVPAGTVTF